MNIKLLKQVQKDILKYPDQFDMWGFFTRNPHTACIAGWAIIRTLDKDSPGKAQKRFVALLPNSGYAHFGMGMACLDISQQLAERLFYTANWPEPFQKQYDTAKTHKAAARIAVKRIDYFITTEL